MNVPRHSLTTGPARFILLAAVLGFLPGRIWSQAADQTRVTGEEPAALVRVTIITETQGAPELFVFDDKLISDYRPKIYRFFPATGVVIDERGHVLSFLGFRWVDLQGVPARIEVASLEGRKASARLVGIDQSLGVAVIQTEAKVFRKTPLCNRCDIRPDDIVMLPAIEDPGNTEFQSARILNIGNRVESGGKGAWQVHLNRPVQRFGEPLLNRRHEVLGFIADENLFYPISQLLTSAGRVIEAGGDIQTGWLGVYVEVEDPKLRSDAGVRIKSVENGSPAHRAGLMPGDSLRSWNGREISDARDFIRNVQETPIGSQVAIGITRQGKPLKLQTIIEARKPQPVSERFVFSFPDASRAPGPPSAGDAQSRRLSDLGMDLVTLTPKLAEALRIDVRSGLLVSNVLPNKLAAGAAIQVGDVILDADGQPTVQPADFYGTLQSREPGSRIRLRIYRKGEELSATIQVP